jgi:hypothetical protein
MFQPSHRTVSPTERLCRHDPLASQSVVVENSPVTVKSSAVNKGVVIVTVQSEKTSFEL